MDATNVGTVVRLKSGGPSMTVQFLNSDGEVYCQWFSGSKLEGGSFPAASLEVVREPSPGR